jgi:hypothetical protein
MGQQIISIWQFLVEGPGDKIANYLGLLFTLIGFGITFISLRNARKETKKEIKNLNTIADLSTAIQMMDEIRRMQRDGDPKVLLDRYSSFKRLLISIKTLYPKLTDSQKISIQTAITQIATAENTVENFIFYKGAKLDVPKTNRSLSNTIDRIYEMLVNIKAGE